MKRLSQSTAVLQFIRRAFLGMVLYFLLTNVAEATIVLQQSFSGVQGTNGIFYEAIGDSRSTNILNPNSAGATPLNYLGVFSFGYPGEVTHPTYAYPGLFPFVQDESANGFLGMHPGTGGFNYGTATANLGVSIRFEAATTGLYGITGGFARNNANQGYGNGVDVLVVKNIDLDNPFFSANISPNHAVNITNPFSGTGVVSFDFQIPLLAGESVRFIVFADGQGQDGTFDGTAIQASIAPVPEPSTLALFSGLGVMGLIAAHRRRKQTA